MELKYNKNSIISGIVTAVVMGIIVVILAIMGLYPPDPPIPEEGVEVNLGNSDYGLGDNMTPDDAESMWSNPSSPSAAENLSTQSSEETVSINANKNNNSTVAKENPAKVEEKTTKEPEINNNALFKKKKTNDNGGSQGVTAGDGNQGKEGGDPNSTRYDGQPGQGGAGFSLVGRSSLSLPKPSYNSNKQGKIIVKIWVNREGVVTRAEAPERGSTITAEAMVAQAKVAAMKAKFNPSPNAAEVQTGTITYTFVAN